MHRDTWMFAVKMIFFSFINSIFVCEWMQMNFIIYSVPAMFAAR